MNIKQILASTEEFFAKHGIENPRLDAEVLLADLLNLERIKLYVKFDYPLTEEELNMYRKRVIKRAKNYPVAYITGTKEFMSLDFNINENVLVPRPETELLVEEVISFCQDKNLYEPHIVDAGTGSGVIMVSLGYYLKKAKIIGIDIKDEILKVARSNIEKYELTDRVKVIKGDLLKPLLKMNKKNVHIVVSNPPYISTKEMKKLPPEVKKEPVIALDGGQDGLELYEKIILQSKKVLKSGGLLALEIGYTQAEAVCGMLKGWDNINVKKDYAGQDRIVMAEKP